MKEIEEILKLVRKHKLYPAINIIRKGISSDPEFVVDNRKVLSFCSFNYLGLANDKEVKKTITEGFDRYGIHTSGAVLISGTLGIHKKLEREIADFLAQEDAMIFNTTTMANMGTIPAVINLPVTSAFSFFRIPFKKSADAVIFSDELNHATIIEGARLAKADKTIYRHCDMNDLEDKLKKYRKKKRKLILTDGVFSMDGDIAPLKDIIELAKKHGAIIFVDDVNATGVLGRNGQGTMEHFGLKDGIDIVVSGFSKCFGVMGGVTATSQHIADYLRVTAKTYMFSGGFSGGLALGVLKALEIIKTDKTRRNKLWENTRYLKNRLQGNGFDTLNSETPIIPIFLGDERIAINMSRDLLNRGILSPAIRWPAVAHGQSRIRFVVTSLHSKEQIDRLVDNLIDTGKKYKVIK